MTKTKRGFKTKEEARAGRARGHEKAKKFASIIGLPSDYQNDPSAKKDVIDLSGDSHSLKSGKKKWQIFLYSKNRVSNDPGFKTFNGFGKLLAALLDAFPEKYEDYCNNKILAKYKLEKAQKNVASKLQLGQDYIEGFFSKAMFNAGEVNYLTIYGEYDHKYHIFYQKDILQILKESLVVENSVARNSKQFNGQKTIFKLKGKNFAELEVRNEARHYREIRFNMMASLALGLFKLIDNSPITMYNEQVVVYGNAKKRFRNKKK